MKLLKDSPTSMSMSESRRLRERLPAFLRENDIRHVLETGTYLGLGSTRMIAEAFAPAAPPASFITIEANWRSWRQARRNLKAYAFVTPLWGRSIALDEAIAFIESDAMLRQHDRYPDIYIDDLDDPAAFYAREMRGKLGESPRHPGERLLRLLDRLAHFAGEDLLASHLRPIRDQRPLVLLDSAGGIGYLEFQKTVALMASRPYWLLLDDIHHIKHVRSVAAMTASPAFTVIEQDRDEGWLLAGHAVG